MTSKQLSQMSPKRSSSEFVWSPFLQLALPSWSRQPSGQLSQRKPTSSPSRSSLGRGSSGHSSQTSPLLSPSKSSCPGLAVTGQLSGKSFGTPSKSLSLSQSSEASERRICTEPGKSVTGACSVPAKVMFPESLKPSS